MVNILNHLKYILFTDIKLGSIVLPINLFELFTKLILPVAGMFIAYKFIKKGFRTTIYRSKIKDDKKDSLFKWVKVILKIIIATVTTLLVVDLLGAQITQYLSAFGNVLTTPFIQGISITTILLIIPIIYLSQVAGKFSQKFAEKSLKSYFKLNKGTRQTIIAVIKNITVAMVMLIGLTVIGIDLTLLIGLFGVIGIGIGFGLQGVISNLFSGVVILTTRTVKVGDHIIVDGTEGTITEIRFLQSIVSTLTHESIIIPNSKLIENPVHNYSFDDRSIIIKNSVQVSYATDLDFALKVLEDVAKNCPYRVVKEEVLTRVSSFDDSGITVAVICWIKDSGDKYAASSYINLEIWRAFKREGIEIPFPQLDLKIKR